MNKKTLTKIAELVKTMGYDAIAKDIKKGYKVKENLQLALNMFKREFKDSEQIESFCNLYLKLL